MSRRTIDNFSPQGGINEKGLAFDYNALPEAPLNPNKELPNKGAIMRKIQQTCATVEEAIALAKKHNWGTSLRWQVLLADATGDAVVISAGSDGELAFTRKPKGDVYLVSTNFLKIYLLTAEIRIIISKRKGHGSNRTGVSQSGNRCLPLDIVAVFNIPG